MAASLGYGALDLIYLHRVPMERLAMLVLGGMLAALFLHETRPYQFKREWKGGDAEAKAKGGRKETKKTK